MSHNVRIIWFGQLRQEHLQQSLGAYLQTEEAQQAIAELLDQGWKVIASGGSGTGSESEWLAFGYVVMAIDETEE